MDELLWSCHLEPRCFGFAENGQALGLIDCRLPDEVSDNGGDEKDDGCQLQNPAPFTRAYQLFSSACSASMNARICLGGIRFKLLNSTSVIRL